VSGYVLSTHSTQITVPPEAFVHLMLEPDRIAILFRQLVKQPRTPFPEARGKLQAPGQPVFTSSAIGRVVLYTLEELTLEVVCTSGYAVT
jgi:hypothetical protein